MNKPVLYTLTLMIFLIFFWWLSGGKIIYGFEGGIPPIVETTAFIFRNFQLGLGFIFNSLANFLGR